MFPYLLIFLFASILFFFNKKGTNFGLFLFFIFFTFLAGFRDMIGGFDVYVYGEIYEAKEIQILNYESFEKGFRLYLLALRKVSNDRYFMFFITSFLMTFLHFRILKKVSPIALFSVFIYFCKFFLMSFVYLRQGLALGIIWSSLLFLDKKYIKFFVLMAIGVFLHKSAILFVPFYFISKIKISTKTMIIVAFTALFISLTSISTALFGFLADNANDDKFNKYINHASEINFFYLFEVFLLIILLIKFKNNFYETEKGKMILNGLFCYIIISILSLTNATFVRFTWYYLIFILLALPSIYEFIKLKEQKRLFKFAVYSYYSMLFFRLLIVYDGGDFMPYKSIFQKFDRHGRWEFMEYR